MINGSRGRSALLRKNLNRTRRDIVKRYQFCLAPLPPIR